MKHLLYMAAFAAVILPACSEDDYKSVNPDGGTEFELSASSSDITLDERNESSEALSLSWTTGTNKGTGNAISYTLEITSADGDYADGYMENLGRKVYSKSFTTKELNNFVKENFGVPDGGIVSCKARVTAYVSGHDELTQVSEAGFAVTTYEPVSATLYMIGGAAPAGWSADNAEEMTRSSTGLFTWTGRLGEGELKFITTLGSFWPAYVRDGEDAENQTLKYFASQPDDALDLKFNIPSAGGYKVTADILNLTVSIEEADVNEPPYSSIWFVSEANSWSFEPMTQDPVNPFIFRYGAEIGNGQFKFGTAQGSWENMYKASSDNADISNSEVVFVSGYDPDNKWLMWNDVSGSKAYKITLDITPDAESMTCTEFTPYDALWLIGSAAPHGWSLDDAAGDDQSRMSVTDDKYVLTWTGKLTAGELKISCDLHRDWNGCWFMADRENKSFGAVEDEFLCFVDSSEEAGVDRKWYVETSGNYTVTVNQLTQKMTVTKN